MKDWRAHQVGPESTIREALACIDRGQNQIALVVDEHGHLLGTVTDGDVRRAILRGVDLNHPVSAIMKRGCRVMKSDDSLESVYSAMLAQGIRHMPIVTFDNRVVGLSVIEEMISPAKLSNPVVVMAGGMGTRLRPHTENVPKPMLEVGGRPMLETILTNLVEAGFQHFYFSVNYKAELIKEYFKDGARWNAHIEYLEEPERRGTAGALTLLPPGAKESILVVNGDVLSKVNFRAVLEFHQAFNSAATLCIRELSLEIPYGVVEVEEYSVRKIVEKPNQRFFVNAGVYALNPATIDLIPHTGMYDMPELVQELLNRDQIVTSFPIREYWLDVGRSSDFEKAKSEFSDVFRSPLPRIP